MPLPNRSRLLTVVATLSVVWALLASVCPTCDVVVHADSATDGRGAEGLRVGGWQPDDDACACCETNRCSGSEDLPQGWFQRPLPSTPAPAVHAVGTLLPPRRPWVVANLRSPGPPPGRAKLHILHASFLC